MNSSQAKRYLAKRGCQFEPGRGGHLVVWKGTRKTTLPMPGGNKEISKGLWLGILKALGLPKD